MGRPRQNNRRLSVYLMREEHRDFKSAIKGNPKEYEVKRGDRAIGILYIKPTHAHRPPWFSLFEGSVQSDLRSKLKNVNVSAIFLVKRKRRIFGIAFGYGRSLLKEGAWEELFGLKVVLNSIDPGKIRVIDRKNLDTMLTHTRTQMSRKCAIEEFNLDVQRVLLKALMGEPKDGTFASSISGADALSITSQVTLDTIESKCDEMLKTFTARNYKKSFAWVDNISEVTDKQKVEELDNEVIERIKSESFERLFLAVPDMVEWTAIDGFKFKESDDELHSDIFLLDFLKTVRNPADISCQFLKQRRVYQVHSDTGLVEAKWPVYHCLNCEITRSSKSYILTESRWYEINPSFVSQVNERLKNIKKSNRKISE